MNISSSVYPTRVVAESRTSSEKKKSSQHLLSSEKSLSTREHRNDLNVPYHMQQRNAMLLLRVRVTCVQGAWALRDKEPMGKSIPAQWSQEGEDERALALAEMWSDGPIRAPGARTRSAAMGEDAANCAYCSNERSHAPVSRTLAGQKNTTWVAPTRAGAAPLSGTHRVRHIFSCSTVAAWTRPMRPSEDIRFSWLCYTRSLHPGPIPQTDLRREIDRQRRAPRLRAPEK